MPVNNTGVGYSNATLEKEDDFFYLINLVASKVRGLEIIKNINLPFLFIDAFAGNGYHEEIDCPGSPIVGLKAIKKAKLSKYKLLLIDRNKSNCDLLRSHFLYDQHVTIRKDDCQNVLKNIIPSIEGYGIVVIDPNGDPIFDVLSHFFSYENTTKLDLCIRFGATNWKRAVSVHEKIDLFDGIKEINKNYWYLKKPKMGLDAFQWTTIFGTNNKNLVPAAKRGFINIDSDEGQCILNVLNHTKDTPIEGYKAKQLPLTAFSGVRY
jgi:hypothetical protein